MSERLCHCGQPATVEIKVSAIPGSADGKLVTILVCEECYERARLAEADLAGTPWEFTLRQDKNAQDDESS